MIQTDLSSYLLAGEHVVWSERPQQGLRFTGRDMFLVPFSLVWLGFVAFWAFSVNKIRAPAFFLLWGAMFLLFGLFFAVGRFFLDAWIRSRLIYVMTNQRVLIFRPAPFANLVALSLNQLPQATLSESSGGRGTIRFGDSGFFGFGVFGRRGGLGGWVPSLDPSPQFLGIEDARTVFNQIQNLSALPGRT